VKIKTIKIENFRSFRSESIPLNRYSCFVGPNGAGKSTVLSALNVFFGERGSATATPGRLVEEDYCDRNTALPVEITLTFEGLSDAAKEAAAAYVRGEELVVTAEAEFDSAVGFGTVRHYGQRLGIEAFREYFEEEKGKASASELKALFAGLREGFSDLPEARSKDAMARALREYEEGHPDDCVLIPSADDFYGVNSSGILSRFVQWVYVPAVKDAGEESQEAKNSALGKLLARAVQGRAGLEEQIVSLRDETMASYRTLLEGNQDGLKAISSSLQSRLESWAHPGVQLDLEWISDADRSVVVQSPVAGIKAGDGGFQGSLARMGHGLQRSYLLALLQELADSDASDAPMLLLGCEEPELYQHPPQARHLSDVFGDLTEGNCQVLVTTHSPYFVRGQGFQDTRLVQKGRDGAGSRVRAVGFDDLCARIRESLGEDTSRPIEGLVAKIHQSLQPGIAEMLFARVPILVEGLEDVSYMTAELHLSDRWTEFRRLGCHIVPVNGKSNLIQPLAIAIMLDLPFFLIFDSDADEGADGKRGRHERDNRALRNLLGLDGDPFPAESEVGTNFAIWRADLTAEVREDFGEDYDALTNAASVRYGLEKGLRKHDLFIADWLTAGRELGLSSTTLGQLCDAILEYARLD